MSKEMRFGLSLKSIDSYRGALHEWSGFNSDDIIATPEHVGCRVIIKLLVDAVDDGAGGTINTYEEVEGVICSAKPNGVIVMFASEFGILRLRLIDHKNVLRIDERIIDQI